MSLNQERVERIRAFAERGRTFEKEYNEIPLSSEIIESYNRKLDETIRGLQMHVKRQEDALREVRGQNLPLVSLNQSLMWRLVPIFKEKCRVAQARLGIQGSTGASSPGEEGIRLAAAIRS
jgi:hypothetical protein